MLLKWEDMYAGVVGITVQVVQPDEDCTVASMLQRHAAVKEDIARYDLETMVVEAVDGWETCRDRMAGMVDCAVCRPQHNPYPRRCI